MASCQKMPYRFGANDGISLSIWDYLFRTAYMPQDGREIELGFDEVEEYPNSFLEQQVYPFKRNGGELSQFKSPPESSHPGSSG